MSEAGTTTSAEDADESPASSACDTAVQLRRLIDLGVYAPIGLVTNKDQVAQDLVARGRRQVAFARSLGRAALRTVSAAAKDRTSAPATAGDDDAAKKASAKKPAAKKASAKKPAAVDGYEEMTARQLVDLAPSLTAEQRAWVRKNEKSGKARVTVLRAVGARS